MMARYKDRIMLYQRFFLYATVFHSLISETSGSTEIHEKIKYHLQEINTGLQELGLDKSHIIQRRSAGDHNDVIFNSLAAFCREFDAGDGQSSKYKTHEANLPSPADLKSVVIPKSKQTDVPKTSPISTWPHLFPTRVQAQREGDKVWLLFDVIHTAQVSVTRLHSFEVKNAWIDYPAELTDYTPHPPVLSKLLFSVDASDCKYASIPYDDHSANIGFILPHERLYTASANINLCMFDYYLNNTSENGEENWEIKKDKIFEETISPPFFKFESPDPGNEVVVERGSDVVLELVFHLKGHIGMSFQVNIWDRDRRYRSKILTSAIRLNKESGIVKVYPAENNSDQDLLSVEVLEETNMKTSSGETDTIANAGTVENKDADVINVKVRVTVKTSVGRRTGKLMLTYFRDQYNGQKQFVVSFLTASRIIVIRDPNKSGILPRNHIDIDKPSQPFKCDNDGIKHYPKHGKNCTIHCYARGTDIAAISISDTHSGRNLVVNSVSQVNEGGNNAFAMIDLGPASQRIEGTYKCVAVTANGKKKKQELKLFTSLFTEVFHNLSMVELDNLTTTVICSAYGQQPLDMSLSIIVNGTTKRLDNQYVGIWGRFFSAEGHYSNLTVLVRTPLLMDVDILCEASGERGTSSMLDGIAVPPDPKISKGTQSQIKPMDDGTFRIECEAMGDEPLEMLITSGAHSEMYRIDDKPGVVRTITNTDYGTKVLTVSVTKEYLNLPKRPGCRASNGYGEAWYDFKGAPDYPGLDLE